MLGIVLQRGISGFYPQGITALGWGGPDPDLTYRVSVVMYGCENWTVKKAEPQRIDAFKLWYWRRLLRVPWTARRSNQLILKEISLNYALEGLMLKLKLVLWPPDAKRRFTGKGPDAGKD